MEYTNYTKKPCRVLIYKSSDYKDHIAMIKFESLADAYRYLDDIILNKPNIAPAHWKNITSVHSFRRYCKKHKNFRGAFFTDRLYVGRYLYFFSLIQAP